MSGWIHTSQQKTLGIDVSLECGLLTNTKVKSKGGNLETATATAGVVVDVWVDGVIARPGEVIFCYRSQELSAKFQGLLYDCLDAEGHLRLTDECLTEEEVGLVLDTVSANSFNFVMNVDQGAHFVEVKSHINTSAVSSNGTALATGIIGKGSAVITEVREIK